MASQALQSTLVVPGTSLQRCMRPAMTILMNTRKMGHIRAAGDPLQQGQAGQRGAPETPTTRSTASLGPARGVATSATHATSAASVAPAEVAIIMGSDSDLPIMKAAAQILDSFGVTYELTVVSAHRTPVRMLKFAQQAHKRGIKVIIAGAGGAAHLPGMVASMSPLPVIGVPVKGSSTDGLDSLLSIVQMPRGIPVATVAIDNAANAGLLAVRILGASEPALLERMLEYQTELENMVIDKAEKLEQDGWERYLRTM